MAMGQAGNVPLSAWAYWKQNIADNAWTSLVVASSVGLAFFVFFDPRWQGSDELPPSWLAHRPICYIVGLLLFWIATMAVSAMNAYLQAVSSLPTPIRRDNRHPLGPNRAVTADSGARVYEPDN